MPGQKILQRASGGLTEVATIQASAGVGSAGLIPALDAAGRLDQTMMPTGVGAEFKVITSSEALAAGDFVNIWNNAGAFAVRKADASAAGGLAKQANGYVLAAFGNAVAATVYTDGINSGQSGLLAGAVYLSDTTPGRASNTEPSGAGKVTQSLGTAVSATEVNVNFGTPVLQA